MKISADKLPKAALKKMSAAQRSYIDEFMFYRNGRRIDAVYAGEYLATWDGKEWRTLHPIPNYLRKPTDPFGVRRDPGSRLKKLGEKMLLWHGGQNDPVYAAGSYFLSGKRHPDPKIEIAALHGLENILRNPHPHWGPLEPRELRGIISSLSRLARKTISKKQTKRPPVRMDSFTEAYIETALWSSTDESDESGGEPLDKNYSMSDIASGTLKRMMRDSRSFQKEEGKDLALSGISPEYAGHDFWLTRNGHGTGFWDRGLGEVGDRLSKASKRYGGFNLYIGDDGKVHGS